MPFPRVLSRNNDIRHGEGMTQKERKSVHVCVLKLPEHSAVTALLSQAPQAKITGQGDLGWDLSVASWGAGGGYQEEGIALMAFKAQKDTDLCSVV